MPYNGVGQFSNPYNWTNDAANGIDILASRMDTQDGGIASGLSNVICKDGQQTTTAIIPFSGGGISLAAGTLLAPSCSIIGDSDTGLAQVSGAGTMAFISNGSKILTFSGTGINGPVGGTTAAAGAFTTITGTSSATLGANSGTIGSILLKGSTSGTTTIVPNVAAGSGILTLPVATDTLIAKATTDTLTNKTYDTAGTGNVLKINGTAITAVTGTGAAVLATSPTLATPTLTAPVISSITNTGALTLPTTTSTLLGVASSTLSGNGFVKLTNGLIFQWGQTGSISSSASSTFAPPLTFPTNFFTLTVTRNTIDNSGVAASAVYALINSTSSITIFNASAQAGVYSWMAIGN